MDLSRNLKEEEIIMKKIILNNRDEARSKTGSGFVLIFKKCKQTYSELFKHFHNTEYQNRNCGSQNKPSFLSILAASIFLLSQNVMALPKAAQIDRYKMQISKALKNKACDKALIYIGKLESLSADLPYTMLFHKGQCLFEIKRYTQSMKTLDSYVEKTGADGKYYHQALEIYSVAEEMEVEQKQAMEAQQKQNLEFKPSSNTLLNTIATNMITVSGKCFQMGQNSNEYQHKVCVGNYGISKFEVTQGQWNALMGNNPSLYKSCGYDCPVERVSWDDVQVFIGKLNEKQSQYSYRLPTEAEWEYACRSGGKLERYCGGENINTLGWYDSNSGNKTHKVGQRQANGLGLYDMSGNVWEWVQDWYSDQYYEKSPINNPQGPSSGSSRVFRGGSWVNGASFCQSAQRYVNSPEERRDNIGFRLARTAK